MQRVEARFMRAALRLAARGLGRTSPNPAVGAVLVKRGAIIGRGYHARCGLPHAEAAAIAAASESPRGADLYVTLEPCGHRGRTPPCADAIIAAGIIPAGLEMMDKPMTAAVEDFVHAGYDLGAEAILLCESDGTPEEVEEEIARMREVLQAAGATRLEVSQDEAQRLKFWSGRKNAFPASGRISPDYMCMDSTIPRKRLADILLAIQQMEKKYQLRCANVFHAGDGNLHPLIMFDANDPDQLHRCELFGAEILATSVAMGLSLIHI